MKNSNYNLPKVSFAIPVLNEEHNIGRCLQSIADQKYPSEKVEVIVADGGSKDRTAEIVESFGFKVIQNPKRLAEPGIVLAHQKSSGDILVYLAADNALPDKFWIKNMVAPFMDDPEILGTYTHIVDDPDDINFNRYYSLLHVEPFTWFVYGDACNPKTFFRAYEIKRECREYCVFDFTPKKHPLIALAQGTCTRSSFRRKDEYEFDDILPVIQMIEEGHKLAYVPNAGIYHYHLNGFLHYIKKYKWRIKNSLENENAGFDKRSQYLSIDRRIKKYLWLIYGGTILGPVYHSLMWSIRDRDPCWFWHIPASVGLTYLIFFEGLKSILSRSFSGWRVKVKT